ncbi:Hypothetical protein R9X50_00389000 [Acrodontium crateriforme]|uniref:Dyp-type peroxidase n=1 Tax=Acrodontium crateriforme TaxID=150365 RepID=A0AAQ3M540_9PEZI|nr:Hypothetical protein R9X50_00389000 [Acrodontium crateriforme]
MSNQKPLGDASFDNVQGDILKDGLPKLTESFLIFQILDNRVKDFCQKLPKVANEISGTSQVAQARQNIRNSKGTIVSHAQANIAFSFNGLQKMATVLKSIDLNTNDSAFEAGMKKTAASLNDPLGPNSSDPAYEPAFLAPEKIHGIILAAGDSIDSCHGKLDTIKGLFGGAIHETMPRIDGKVRPGNMKGHEHFGYLDGVSQPAIDGVDQAPPGQDTISPGVILCGRPGDDAGHPAWMTDGSFLCFRKLEQKVPEWNKFLVDASNQLGTWSKQLGARLIGRWESGCPVELQSEFDDVNIANDPNQINKFEFDPNNNFRCPLGAHIRKTNPRGDLGRNIVNRFRILRRGIPYGNEVDVDPTGSRGLLFVCYQSNLNTGFNFIQRQWANNAGFIGNGAGLDAIVGQDNNNKTVDMAGLFPQDASRTFAFSGINRFVIPRGGEYFFTPSITALKGTLATTK